jgi:pantoate--beta-alanine ligase
MGALHTGHMALINICKTKGHFSIASIFVNPTQFNDPADFEKYPKTLEKDIRLLESHGCDVLFLPSASEIYPNGMLQLPHYNLGALDQIWEGSHRPGHFQGVCQVVHRLLLAVRPGHLFMGQKDFQQCMVVSRLLELTRLPVELHICPTVREDSGLALSSRNMRLSQEGRQQATEIFRQLRYIQHHIGRLPVALLEQQAAEALLRAGFSKVDYIAVCRQETLEHLTKWDAGIAAVIIAAAFLNDVRLIDNLVVEPKRLGS